MSLPKRRVKPSNKIIKGVAKLWADDVNEFYEIYNLGKKYIHEDNLTLFHLRCVCVSNEVTKITKAKLIPSEKRLMQMLVCKDVEVSHMAMLMVYELRDKRLNMLRHEEDNTKT